MVHKLKKIFRILFERPKVQKSPAVSPIANFTSKGNLRIGNNTDISSLALHIYGAEEGIQNVVIGDDCWIQGSIVLHTKKSKVKIGDRVFVGPGTTIFVYDEIELGNDIMISWGCTLIDTNAHSLKSDERMNDVLDWKKGWEHKNWNVVESKKIIVNSKCWIGFNSIIMKGVILGKGCIVASGSVVTKSFDPYSLIGGNPAQFIRTTE